MSQSVAAVWAADLEGIALADAVQALTLHYRESDVWLLPSHVRANVRRLRAVREREARVLAPKAVTGNVITLDRAEFERQTEAFIAQYRAERAAKAES